MPRRRFPLAPTLTVVIGLLVVLAVGSVLWIEWSASRQILATLGGRIVERNVHQIEEGIERHLDPPRHAVESLGQWIESGDYGLDEPGPLADLLKGAVAAAPEIGGLYVADDRGRGMRLLREADGGGLRVERLDAETSPGIAEAVEEAAGRSGSYWGELFYDTDVGVTLINVRRRFRRDATHHGVVAAAVTVRELSHLLAGIDARSGLNTFVLLGDEQVLAHASLVNGHPDQSVESPLVTRARLGDPVIAALDRVESSNLLDVDPSTGRFLELTVDGVLYFVLGRRLEAYGDPPVVVGSYRRASEVDAPIRLLYSAGAAGLCGLVLAVVAALVLSRRIASPVRRVSAAAARVGDLDFDEVEDIAPSSIREIDDLASAFNRMLVGLRSFGTYVPRSLVTRLVRQVGGAGVVSEERELSVMFTDIAGFTSMCEGMDAREVAAFINDHLALLAECVEREAGTIDKYIGDALMAFWGAPERLENTAVHACRAALAMQRAIAADNERRRAAGRRPIRLRIGIHTGPLVVGNIGAPSRINYTVVGDTVNTTQRLESLGKEVAPDAEVCILISASVRERLPEEFSTEQAGSFQVKGKEQEVEVYRLLAEGPVSSGCV